MDEKTFMQKFSMLTLSKKDMIEAQDTINQYIELLETRNKTLNQKLDNYNKDEEIQKLKNEIDKVKRKSLVVLTNSEEKALVKFFKKHKETCGLETVQIIVTPTEIGTAIEVQCNKCNETKNITDFDVW